MSYSDSSTVKDRYQIFDNLIEGVQIIDPDYNYIYVNEAVSRQAKVDRKELLGENMVTKFPGIENTPMFNLLKECLGTGGKKQLINEFEFPDGSKGFFELRLERVAEGVLIMSFDVTDVIRAQQVLENANEKLEMEVKRRTAEIEAQKELIENQVAKLERLNETKDKFFSIVAHDLRSPLNSLKSFSSLLMDGLVGVDESDVKNIGRELHMSLENATKLVENLFAWARLQMEDTSSKPEEIKLERVIEECIAIYAPIAEKKKVRLVKSSSPGLLVYFDQNHLLFIIRNLINNAIKFTQEGGLVEVSSSHEGDEIVISVVDSGIGMTEEEVEQLFELRVRAGHQGTAGEPGTGLGLILVDEFLKLNNGRIQVRSTKGTGSAFSVFLPKPNR